MRREATYKSDSGSTTLVFGRTATEADAGTDAAKALANGLIENGWRANFDFGTAPVVASVSIAAQAGEDGARAEEIQRSVRPGCSHEARHGPGILGENDELAPSSVQSPSG